MFKSRKNNKRKIIFHPGFPKTGSTYIQEIFNNSENIENLYYLYNHNEFWHLTNNLFKSKNKKNNNKLIKKFIDSIYKINTKKKIYVYSYEGILNPYRFNQEQNFKTFIRIIKLLKKDFDISILITLREQTSLLKSWYLSSYDIFKKDFKTFSDFYNHETSNKRINKFLDYNYFNKKLFELTKIKINYIFYNDIKNNKRNYKKNLQNLLETKKVILPQKKIGAGKKNDQHYYVIDNEFYYFLSKINLILNKKIKYYNSFTKEIKMFLKNRFNIKKKKYIFSNNNFFKKNNKLFFQSLKLNNKF